MRAAQPLQIRFDAFQLDEADARLKRGVEVLDLPPRAFAVLCTLARQPGQLVTKDALLDAVWGHRHVSESVLKSTVSQLRAALGDDARAPRFIETAARRGYRFIATAVPAGGASSSDATMTGRAALLSELQAAWARACGGQRQLCWLAGEAGIGKTTLVDHFAASLGPVAFAEGRCVEQHGPGEPYLPVLEALAMLCRDDPQLTPLLRSVAPTWLLQLPWLCSEAEREGLRRELAGGSQNRMLREFGELLDRYTQHKPLLLVTEDLHWSDHATVHLLNHVARRRGPARWMWLATFRVAEVIAEDHPARALRHELRLHRLGHELLVDPFSEQELADYIARRLGGPAWPDDVVQALHRHTDGLPLFVAHVIDELLAQGALPTSGAGPSGLGFDALAVPESLAGVIEKQIRRLPAEQVALLEAASACGPDFRPAVLARAIGREAAWIASQCEQLAQGRRWLLPTQVARGADGQLQARYAFRHALLRRVFHERMGALARVDVHRRLALALADTPGAAVSAAELAAQFELAQEPDAALPHVVAAAAAALQQFAAVDALQLADRGHALAERCRPGAPLPALLATLHSLRGAASAVLAGVSADDTLHSFGEAQRAMANLPAHPLRSMVLHGLGLGLFLRHGPPRARELAEQSLADALQRHDPVLTVAACDLLGQILKLEGPPGEAIAVLEQGIAAAAALDEATLQSAFVLDPLVNMQAALALPLLLAGCDRRSKVQSDLALARARALKQPMARMIATWLALLCEVRRGARDTVAMLATQLRDITEEGALAHAEGPGQWFAGLVAAWSGDAAQGHAQIAAAYRQYAQVGMLYGSAEVLGYAGEALLLAGDRAGAGRQIDEALQLAERLHDHSYRCQLWLLKRRIALDLGMEANAEDAARQALAEARRQGSPWLEMAVLVEVCEAPSASGEDMASLQAVLAAVEEGSTAPLTQRARRLLAGP